MQWARVIITPVVTITMIAASVWVALSCKCQNEMGETSTIMWVAATSRKVDYSYNHQNSIHFILTFTTVIYQLH